MFHRILIVCIGNICRSPTAEFLFRRAFAGRDIEWGSAGLGALVNRPMDPLAQALLAEHGLDGSAHRARQLTPALMRQADLVLAMEQGHVGSMQRLAPEASGKVMLLDKWGAGQDIPDPYRQQRPAFEHVYELIERSVASWQPYL